MIYDLGIESPARPTMAARSESTSSQIVDNYPQSHIPARRAAGGRRHLLEARGPSNPTSERSASFKQFLSFYPLHPRAEYAQYKIGMAHYVQVRSALSATRRKPRAAIEAFDSVRRAISHQRADGRSSDETPGDARPI